MWSSTDICTFNVCYDYRRLHQSCQARIFFYNFNRDRFWNALVNYGVAAYICGHTHNHSVINIDGVWQIDAGSKEEKGIIAEGYIKR